MFNLKNPKQQYLHHPILLIATIAERIRITDFSGMLYTTVRVHVFLPWGTRESPIQRKFCQSPHPTLVPVFGPRLVPPPAEVCP